MALPEIWDVVCGYRVLVAMSAERPGAHKIQVCALFANGGSWEQERVVTIGQSDYRSGPYGSLLDANVTHVYRRHDIYSVGPPSAVASQECVALLHSYLSAGERVLDVGCGVGAYGPPLISAGVDWHGCEVNEDFVTQLRERNLPVSLVDGPILPFENASFESAICIEVLEHIDDYRAFLREIARVTKRRVLFSVPNAEAIPVLADQLVVPWHLLEADHKNFFTRSGLCALLEQHFRHAEIVPYGGMPMPSSNHAPVFYHLFAIAEC